MPSHEECDALTDLLMAAWLALADLAERLDDDTAPSARADVGAALAAVDAALRHTCGAAPATACRPDVLSPQFAPEPVTTGSVLDSRSLIGRAQSVLASRYELDSDDAFRLLARMSLRTGTRLREVAGRIVDGYLTGPRSRTRA